MPELQTIAALSIAIMATSYLLRRVWQMFAGGTGGCGSCASGGCGGKSEELMQLDNVRDK